MPLTISIKVLSISRAFEKILYQLQVIQCPILNCEKERLLASVDGILRDNKYLGLETKSQ